MSWVEKINYDLIITTGDGKKYKPLWLNANKGVEYNVSEFDFPNVNGTFVDRKRPRGRKFPLEIYFQGDDNIDQASAFEISASDPRPWIIAHPYYGNLTVQPISLNFDNSLHNVTKITGTVAETITENYPKGSISPSDKISADKETLDTTFSVSFANNVQPSTADVNSLTENTQELYSAGAKQVKLTDQAAEYFNLFNKANAAILNATSEPLIAIQAVKDVINYPSLLQESVQARLDLFVGQLDLLSFEISNLLTPSSKRIYENNAGILISAMLFSASTPLDNTDYGNRDSVFRVIETLLNAYNSYVEALDSIQTENGGSPESYIPDASSLIALNGLLTFTISNLFNIALNAKQERVIYLEQDSNVILLSHRFYGPSQDDSNIDKFILNNNIGLDELLQIKKGRKLIYYI